MLQTRLNYPSLYNPAIQTEEEILANFIVRVGEFNELFNAIKNDKMKKPPQHFIILGQRGYGKTTLLLRLKIEIKKYKDLNTWLVPVMFDEEQYSVRTLAKMWEEIIEVLESEDSAFDGLSEKIDPLYDRENPEEEVYKLLIKSLKEYNKKIVLLLDNFGDMIQKFNKKENQRLREVLMTCSYIRLIGASSSILEFHYDYKQPFFDFFKIVTLKELSRDDTILLLRKLGETYKNEAINEIIKNQPGRIDSLRQLTGGVPRTIVLLFQIFVDDVNGDSFKDLEVVLDNVTPLYKDRLDSLKSPVQQAIIDAVAQNWDAISTKEIAKKVRIPSKEVSAQLNSLEKNQLIRKIQTTTKNQLYQISERFFNIYYLMRLGRRKNRNKVLWLLKFFEIMCGEKELVKRVQLHLQGIREGNVYHKHVYYVSQALAKTHIPVDLQHELLNETKKYLEAKHSEFITDVDKSHLEIIDEVRIDIKNGKYNIAQKKLKDDGMNPGEISFITAELLRTEKKDYSKAIEYYEDAIGKGISFAMFNLAFLYQEEYKDLDKAEKYYLMAIEKDNVSAMFNLALLNHKEFKNFKNAEKYYMMAIENGNYNAMNNLALMYQDEFKDFKNAEKYFLMAAEKDNVNAFLNLALMYQNEFKDFKGAKKYYMMAIEKDDSGAMNNLALIYQNEYKDFKNAEKYYLLAIEKDNSMAMNNLALMYITEFKDIKNAEKYLRMAIKKDDSRAMNNLALMYQNEYKDIKNAEKYYLMAIEKNNSGAMNNLALMYFINHFNKNEALTLIKKLIKLSNEWNTITISILVLLWNDDIDGAVKLFKRFVENEKIQKDVYPEVHYILLMYLTKNQYHFVLKLFEENKFDIRDKYKPIYYAALKLSGEKYINELKRMPPEISESVEEVIKEINQMSIDYK